MNKTIIGYEYKHGTFANSNKNRDDDAVIVKEVIHYSDGTTEPHMRILRNYPVPFYIVKPDRRTFKQKRTWIDKTWCHKYETNLRKLPFEASKLLKMYNVPPMKVLNRSPYIAGTDISVPVLIKHRYKTKYPHLITPYTTCHLDIETDMHTRTRDINMVSVTMKGRVFQAIVRTFIQSIDDPIARIKETQEKEILPLLLEAKLKIYCKENNIKYSQQWREENQHALPITAADVAINTEIILVDTPAQAVLETFKRVHAWKPDILSIWNLPFDLGHMIKALEKEGHSPKEVFSDPGIPEEFRFFDFLEGKANIPDANGKGMSRDPSERWHRVSVPSSFFWADQMSVRRAVRRHNPKESSYALGKILEKELGHGKLKGDAFTDATGPDWHREMQRHHKVYYCVYNQWDNLGAQLLDEMTQDMCLTFPSQCQYSELQSYGSQGRRLCDDLYFFLLEKGYVLTGVSDQMETELDKHSVTLEGWICTLPAHLIHPDMGRKILQESDTATKIIKLVLDIDVKSSYPSTGVWMNISRDTIYRVMDRIVGVPFEEQRRLGLNLPAGRVNAMDIGTTIFNMPRPIEWMAMYERKIETKK